MKQSLLFLACIIILLASSCTKNVADKPVDNGGPYFSQVKQIIQTNCVSCHHQGGQGMPVILTSDDDIVNRAAAIKAAVADPVSPTNKRMPQDGQLSDADKNTIVAWFNKGGKASD